MARIERGGGFDPSRPKKSEVQAERLALDRDNVAASQSRKSESVARELAEDENDGGYDNRAIDENDPVYQKWIADHNSKPREDKMGPENGSMEEIAKNAVIDKNKFKTADEIDDPNRLMQAEYKMTPDGLMVPVVEMNQDELNNAGLQKELTEQNNLMEKVIANAQPENAQPTPASETSASDSAQPKIEKQGSGDSGILIADEQVKIIDRRFDAQSDDSFSQRLERAGSDQVDAASDAARAAEAFEDRMMAKKAEKAQQVAAGSEQPHPNPAVLKLEDDARNDSGLVPENAVKRQYGRESIIINDDKSKGEADSEHDSDGSEGPRLKVDGEDGENAEVLDEANVISESYEVDGDPAEPSMEEDGGNGDEASVNEDEVAKNESTNTNEQKMWHAWLLQHLNPLANIVLRDGKIISSTELSKLQLPDYFKVADGVLDNQGALDLVKNSNHSEEGAHHIYPVAIEIVHDSTNLIKTEANSLSESNLKEELKNIVSKTIEEGNFDRARQLLEEFGNAPKVPVESRLTMRELGGRLGNRLKRAALRAWGGLTAIYDRWGSAEASPSGLADNKNEINDEEEQNLESKVVDKVNQGIDTHENESLLALRELKANFENLQQKYSQELTNQFALLNKENNESNPGPERFDLYVIQNSLDRVLHAKFAKLDFHDRQLRLQDRISTLEEMDVASLSEGEKADHEATIKEANDSLKQLNDQIEIIEAEEKLAEQMLIELSLGLKEIVEKGNANGKNLRDFITSFDQKQLHVLNHRELGADIADDLELRIEQVKKMNANEKQAA